MVKYYMSIFLLSGIVISISLFSQSINHLTREANVRVDHSDVVIPATYLSVKQPVDSSFISLKTSEFVEQKPVRLIEKQVLAVKKIEPLEKKSQLIDKKIGWITYVKIISFTFTLIGSFGVMVLSILFNWQRRNR